MYVVLKHYNYNGKANESHSYVIWLGGLAGHFRISEERFRSDVIKSSQLLADWKGLYGWKIQGENWFSFTSIMGQWSLKSSSTNGSSRRSPSQVRTMATEVVKLYISLLSEFFSLSDMAVVSSPGGSVTMAEASFLPPGTNSLSASFYLSRILQEITECVNDIGATEMSSEAGVGLKELLDATRSKFEDALGFTWLRGQFLALFGYSPY